MQNVGEKQFYNSLNLFYQSDYKKLEKAKRAHDSWENAWMNLSREERAARNPEKDWEVVARLGLKLVLRESEEYPALLREIHAAPFGIYVLGTLPREGSQKISVVGTRKATSEGKEFARAFGKRLAEADFIIVSGLALGIDAAAHEGCLEARGKTVAVLANGLDSFYPRTNERIAKNILESGGAIISEYPPGAHALPHRFLERNRIVSGLSGGTLVIEAPEQSGSLATARFALEQNRDVFVIPGPISHPNFKGSNQLIRQGAELVTKPEEILEAYGIAGENKTVVDLSSASPEERQVVSALRSTSRAIDIDKIIEMTTLEPQVVNRFLSFLVIKNIVKETEGGYTMN